MKNKQFVVGMLFLMGIVLISSFVTSYQSSTFNYGLSGSFSDYGSSYFDTEQCEAGQDFALTISQIGCTPAIVRSDLLEEQNVPVFCPVQATKMNPLITVKAIEGISFSGEYPEEVSGVGFHPAKAALGTSSNLNTALLDNIGYVVVVLKKQKNESSMPDYVSGNLTASLKYDIENAFGIGKASFFLPQLSDSEWDNRKNSYSFWRGRGSVRAESVDEDSARISIYEGDKKISSVNLEKGDTSNMIYLSGMNCLAGLKVKLDGLRNPDTTVRLRVNSDIIEVIEDEKFLENRCSVTDISYKGLNQEVKIKCKGDDETDSFILVITPSFKLDFTGQEKESYEVGDFLFEDDGKFVYLAYVGSNGRSNNLKDLRALLVGLDTKKDRLTEDEISSWAKFASKFEGKSITGTGWADLAVNIGRVYFGIGSTLYHVINGKSFSFIEYQKINTNFDRDVRIVDFAQGNNLEVSDDGTFSTYYGKAKDDYNTILDSFPNEKQNPGNDAEETLGERALLAKLVLAYDTGQKEDLLEFCNEFRNRYADSETEISGYCDNSYLISNLGVSTQEVLINGVPRTISFEGIYEPTEDEFSAVVEVRGPNGNRESFTLRKDNEIYLEGFRDTKEDIYKISQGTLKFDVYFRYNSNKWEWSLDKENWINLDKIEFTISGDIDAEDQVKEITEEKTLELLNNLKGKDLDAGKLILENYDGQNLLTSEFIVLTDLDKESAKIEFNLKKSSIVGSLQSYSKTLKKGVLTSISDEYAVVLKEINLKKIAKVSLIPNIKNTGTSANFTFKIGIEKRAIQLSPEKIRSKIKALNESIAKWEKVSENLGTVVKGLKTACLGVGAGLTIKNFFSNWGGKGIARQNVMRGEGGWYDKCEELVSKGTYDSIDECFSDNSDEIDSDVDAYYEELEKQNAEIKALQGNYQTSTVSSLFTEKVIDEDKFRAAYLASAEDELKENLQDKFPNGIKLSSGETIGIEEFIDSLDKDKLTTEELRSIQLNARLSGTLEDTAVEELKTTITSIYQRNKDEVELKNVADNFGLQSEDVSVITKKDAKELPYTGKVYGDISDKITIISGAVGDDENYAVPIYLEENTPIQIILTSEGKKYIAVLEKNGNQYIIKENGLYNFNGNSVEDKNLNVYFKKYDSSTYENSYKNPEVRYYETEPYEGLPAIVPFDCKNGWYASMTQTLPLLGNIQSYDESGRVTSFYVCNVGENGQEETRGGDDICQMINTGTGQPYNTFPGLSSSDASKIIQKAVSAIELASKRYSSGVSSLTINDCKVKVGSPAVDIPDIQCQDFMSPSDCKILFNVCDPVICPSSRCDFGGKYPVKDVIQSGIIGSILLCLPNFKEGIYMPVCITGVKAGLDALISVQKSYRDCLQESLDTGETVGICDEIHSIYLCEFLWKQAIPLVKLGLPKILEFLFGDNVRGGGEYSGLSNAWSTAQQSVNYFTQYYGASSYEAFKARSAEDAGGEICKIYSSSGIGGKSVLDTLTDPDSPPQFYGRFSSTSFTTATNPPQSHYKVYYHIYAGNDSRVFYKIYLQPGSGGSFYQDTSSTLFVASGYIARGEYASETKDFTAPEGYKELCIDVNGDIECGFQQVTSSFAVNYITDQYIEEQAGDTDIKTEAECISGSSSLYSLLNPNLQSGADELINSEIYNYGIIRICATDNPGKGTDAFVDTANARWIDVGYCGDETMRCWLDTDSVSNSVNFNSTAGDILEDVTNAYLEAMIEEGDYITDFDSELEKIDKADSAGEKITLINKIIDKVFFNHQKAYLYFLRGNAYSDLTLSALIAARIEALADSIDEEDMEVDQNETEASTGEEVELEDRSAFGNFDYKEGVVDENHLKELITFANKNDIDGRKCNCGEDCISYPKILFEASSEYNVDPILLLAIMLQESSCEIDSTSSSEAVGLMQIVDWDLCKDELSLTGKEGLEGYGNILRNVKCGAIILKKKYELYKDGTVFYYKDRSTNPHSCFNENNIKYYNWEAALRGYVGYDCPGTSSCDDTCKKEHDAYVERVVEKYSILYQKFLSVKDST